MARQLFISYSTDDTATTEQIRDHLEASGISCWMAPRDIAPGLDYAEQIISAIEGCPVLLLVLSESSNRSQYVRNEVERAIAKHKVVIPFRIHNVTPSRSLEFFISNAQWIDAWQEPLTTKLPTLVSAIQGHLHGSSEQQIATPVLSSALSPLLSQVDWGEAPDVSGFQGRQEDELRMVTVLCIGLVEPLVTEQLYPTAQTAQRVKQFVQLVETTLQRYEGRVERVLGEGVVALFGTQQLHEDDPERAVRAALEVREATHAKGWRVSAALNSGHVYLSRSGTTVTAIGPVVNLALRLQAKADVDQMLVSEATYRQARGVAIYTPLSLALQSNAAPLAVYQIERLQPQPQKVRGIAGLHAPLVGRSKELTALQEALAVMQNGEGQLITLIGDAGVGKSRLVSELKQADKETRRQGDKETRRQGDRETGRQGDREINSSRIALSPSPFPPFSPSPCLWLEGHCLEMSISASYWPFLDILRTHLDWQPEEMESSRAARIVTMLDALMSSGKLTAEQREEMGPLLGNLLAVRFGNDWDERLKFAGPEQIRHQTLITLRDFFDALTKQQPVVLVLEDLHWADSLSLDLIALLMETLAEQPLLLLCVYRPERQHRCWQLATLATAKCPDSFTEVRLRELTSRQSQQLVEALLTIDNLAPRVKETILQKAQGNPLFVEEVIRSLIDAGIVYRQDEVWRAKGEIENIVVPETVQSVILSRVDRLDEALKGLLQRAAVIGRVFGRRLLEQLIPPGLDLDSAVLALTNHAFIYQERVVPEEEYSFKHVLVQEAIYQNTLAERRQQFHQQVGEAMEQLYANNLAERYEQLAYHFDRSGVVEKAIEYLLKAGEKARRAYLNEEAIRYFQQAQEQLARQEKLSPKPLSQASKDWRLEALDRLGQTYLGIGKMAEAETYFWQAIALAKVIGIAPHQLVRLYFGLGEIFWWQNRFDERIQLGEEGLSLLMDDQQSVEAALMNSLIAWGYYFKADIEKAGKYTFQNASFVDQLAYTEDLAHVYIQIIIAYTFFDKNLTKAKKWAHLFEENTKQNHDLRGLAGMYLHLAMMIFQGTGDLHSAVFYYQKSLELYNKIGDVTHVAHTLSFMSDCLLELGDLQQAEEQARRAIDTLQQVGHASYVARLHFILGIVSLCRGLSQDALIAFDKARQLCQQIGSPAEVWPLIALGQANLRLANPKESLQLFQKALSLIRPTEHLFWQQSFARALSSLEAVYDSADSFHTLCRRLQVERPDLQTGASVLIPPGKRISNRFIQWFLEPTQPDLRFTIYDFGLRADEIQNLQSKACTEHSERIQNGEWSWHDPFADCTFQVDDALEIQAANGRSLYYVNLSAPRLLRPASGDFATQTVCLPVSDEKPAQGGILLWKDQENYLHLDRGTYGKHEIAFSGCLGNNDVIIGRGRLPAERVFLRLERIGERVNALCSADGEEWFTVGHVDFPVTDPVQVGMHAIGNIDRLIYPGAYPDGTAIRFESFAVYKAAEEIELTSGAEQPIVSL